MPAESTPINQNSVPAPFADLVASRFAQEAKGRGLGIWSRWLSVSRILVFFLILAGFWQVFGSGNWRWYWLLPLGILFLALLAIHERLHSQFRGHLFRLKLHDWSIARLENRWHGQGVSGVGLLPQDHPYAADLDILGVGSLFESICLAKTQLGQRTLANWLGHPENHDQVLKRQEAVQELAKGFEDRLDLVEKSGGMQSGQDLDPTLQWANQKIAGPHWAVVAFAVVLGICNLLALIRWISGTNDSLEVAVCLLLTAIIYALNWKRIRESTKGLEKQAEALLAARGALASISAKSGWKSETLFKLRGRLKSDLDPQSASNAVDRLVTLVQAWQARKNPLITIPLVLLFWDLVFAWLLSGWHKKHAVGLSGWLTSLGDYEALQSLAHQSFLFPQDVFPRLLDKGPATYTARDLGHPLLPLSHCVRNQVELAPPRQMLLVSGSNMSGKSTYLRSVGVSAVLAWAGAPVRASSMEIGQFQVAAILHAEDSLRLGMSRFAAELARMRRVIELSKNELPLLFLLDEIFSGTNSSDRLAGAEALIFRLVNSGAVGMVTTHDLTLAKIADELQEKAGNVHFVDSWSGGRMSFDYRLQPGVVPRSNALGLMRAIGLEI